MDKNYGSVFGFGTANTNTKQDIKKQLFNYYDYGSQHCAITCSWLPRASSTL